MAFNELPNQQTMNIPHLSTTDQFWLEHSQLFSEIDNQRANLQLYLQEQHLQTTNVIHIEQANQETLVQDYASRLLAVIYQKEQELATALSANSVLQNRVVDVQAQLITLQERVREKEATVAELNQELESTRRSQQMMMANEPDAGSSC